MTSITPSSGNVFSDLGLDPEARALEIVDRLVGIMDFPSRKAVLVRDIADAIRDGAGGMGEAKHPTGIECKFENGAISIRIGWGDSDTFIELSDEFMAGVRAHYTEDLVAACRIALEYWISDHPNDTVDGIDAREKIVAALAKAVGER